jgi:hypothetical protein
MLQLNTNRFVSSKEAKGVFLRCHDPGEDENSLRSKVTKKRKPINRTLIEPYVSSYCYVSSIFILLTCVFILLFMCPHTTMCVLVLLYVCPHTAMSLAFSFCLCVLILICVCPHTTVYVSSYCYVSSVFILLVRVHSSYCYVCPYSTIYVSSYYYICVLIVL